MPGEPTTAAYRVLRDVFGFESFRPGQEAAIETLLAGRHALTVVVSPLIALMQDQVAALRLAGVAADCINSAKGRADNVAAWRGAAAGETLLLYMAPERLMTERMLAALARLPVRLFAIDEAHCISQWGPAFRPEYEDLCRLRDLFPGVPIVALTATADEVTRDDIAEKLFGRRVEHFVLGFDRPNIKLTVEMKREWKRQLRSFVARHEGESGIVYCLSRKKTKETAAMLATEGVSALPYHAGMEKEEREAHQNIFMTDPGVVIVATIAFGMGIDKADVRYVFHTDLPGSVEAYYQEIGRAGRDGAPAEVHMLYGLADIRMRRQFIEEEDAGAGAERKRREHKRLDALLGYCEAPACRRVALLDYFGEQTGACGNCDCCLDPSERVDGTEDAQKILSTIQHSGERFGAAHVIDILRGTETEKIVRFGHVRLPTFRTGAGRGKNEWRSLIRQMVATGFLRLDIAGYGGLGITDKGRDLLRGKGAFRYREETVAARPSAPSRETRGKEPEHPLSGDQTALLDVLKALRLRLAKERGVPAYIVFSDRTLIDMARRRPRTKEELAEVNGVGAAKLEQFAAPFLAAIDGARSDAG